MSLDNNPLLAESVMRSIELPTLPEEPIYLSEADFRRTWFPVFMNYFAGTEDGQIQLWMMHVSGSWYKEVHVVENIRDPRNTYLFTVPAVFARNENLYTEMKEEDIDIEKILTLADLNNQNFPGSGDNLIKENITDKVKPTTPSMVETEQWRKIYEYYEVDAPFLHTDEARKARGETGSSVQEEVVGFDDDF